MAEQLSGEEYARQYMLAAGQYVAPKAVVAPPAPAPVTTAYMGLPPLMPAEVLEQVRSTIRWRIHLLVALALITLGWFGYQSWRSVVTKRPERTTIDPD